MGAPLRAVLKQLVTRTVSPDLGKPIALVHHPNESFFLVPQAYKVIVIFPIRFSDSIDTILATSFLQIPRRTDQQNSNGRIPVEVRKTTASRYSPNYQIVRPKSLPRRGGRILHNCPNPVAHRDSGASRLRLVTDVMIGYGRANAIFVSASEDRTCKVLDGQMLKIWTDRATEIAQHGWFWEYNLLNLAIDSVTVSADGRRAIVEATLEESASLTDVAHPEHNDSYSTAYNRFMLKCQA
ncbi:hypothetical protein FXO37_08587 [Capsicum annuum]|nr:hypothetical protein FXO37_08587 [Capsicum annuum]